ncbi:N-acetylmuramoyl-L-alanine amidase [Allocoleopsis sp.]|uniref:N-acetylmuramoyl-L-alanine amidase n=1 Tax=Allocoleopsis sp. TaxID=3088169 RepID=UPI002FD68D7F
MRYVLGLALLGTVIASPAWAEQPLSVVYPPPNHKTTADRIFFIGTAPSSGEVVVNGKAIARSPAGHFAPSFPLQLGENQFTVRYQNQQVQIKVTRTSTQPTLPTGLAFSKDSLTPAVDIATMPGELVCFGAIASPNASVSVKLANQTIPLLPQSQDVDLPANSAALTQANQPIPRVPAGAEVGKYQGCATAEAPGNLGLPQFQLTLNGQSISQAGSGKISILSPAKLEVAEVISEAGVARTGPSTDYSRLTPLPKGSKATVIGREGEWVRLDYGAWIKASEVRIVPGAVPPKSLIRSIRSRNVEGATEVLFPLQVPVPVTVQQSDRRFTLTLYNTTAQTDIIRLEDNPLISRLDWQQVAPGQVQYTFNLKTQQQWGYNLRYEGTTLVLSLRHPSRVSSQALNSSSQNPQSLSGIKILLDAGHGGTESGASGPTGYLEKNVTLIMAKLVRERLLEKGATVYMTREEDKDVSLQDRVAMIDKLKPAIAISIHYNSLPDEGDAQNTKGMGAFWYNTQAHSLAVFLHDYIVKKLGRPSYGVFWDNLALTRPNSTPSVLLELGFMSNPVEFEWVTNPQEQPKLARAIADGITEWFFSQK